MPQVSQPYDAQFQRPVERLGLAPILGEVAANAANREIASLLPNAQDKLAQAEADKINLGTDNAKTEQALQVRQRLAGNPNAADIAAKSVGWNSNNPNLAGYSAQQEASSQGMTNIAQSSGLSPAQGASAQVPLAVQQTSSPVVPPQVPLTSSPVSAAPQAQGQSAPSSVPSGSGSPTAALTQATPPADPLAAASTPEAQGQAIQKLAQIHASLPPDEQTSANQKIQQAMTYAKAAEMFSDPTHMNPINLGLLANVMDAHSGVMGDLRTQYKLNSGQLPTPPGFNDMDAATYIRLRDQMAYDPKGAQAALEANPNLQQYAPGGTMDIPKIAGDYAPQYLAMLRGMSSGIPTEALLHYQLGNKQLEQSGQQFQQELALRQQEAETHKAEFGQNLQFMQDKFQFEKPLDLQAAQNQSISTYANASVALKGVDLRGQEINLMKQSNAAAIRQQQFQRVLSTAQLGMEFQNKDWQNAMNELSVNANQLQVIKGIAQDAAAMGLGSTDNGKQVIANIHKALGDAESQYLKSTADTINRLHTTPIQFSNVVGRLMTGISSDPDAVKAGALGTAQTMKSAADSNISVQDAAFKGELDKNPEMKKIQDRPTFERWMSHQPSALQTLKPEEKTALYQRLLKFNGVKKMDSNG